MSVQFELVAKMKQLRADLLLVYENTRERCNQLELQSICSSFSPSDRLTTRGSLERRCPCF